MYDEVGNLIQDKAEEIDNIEWNVYGKVKKVTRFSANPASNKPDLEFVYDPMGNRICKIVKPRTSGVLSTQQAWTYTWYSLDAQGQTMATYEMKYEQLPSEGAYRASFDMQETYIYGSSRIGVLNDDPANIELTRDFTASIYGPTGLFINISWSAANFTQPCSTHCVNEYAQELGHKQYEISNHLGNVMTTISDRRIPVAAGSVLNHYIADVISSQDYYPYGSVMPGRNSSSEDYRYGMNKQESDKEISGTWGTHYSAMFWEYDSRLGRRWNVDPVVKPWESSYSCFNNNPIFNRDVYGNDATKSGLRKFLARINPWEKVRKNAQGVELVFKTSFHLGTIGKAQLRIKREVKSYRVYSVTFSKVSTETLTDDTESPTFNSGYAKKEINLYKYKDIEVDHYSIYQPDEKRNKTYVNGDPNLRTLSGDDEKVIIESTLIPNKQDDATESYYRYPGNDLPQYQSDQFHPQPYSTQVNITAISKPVYVKVPKRWWGGNNWNKMEINYVPITEGKEKDTISGKRQRGN
jgi:hypothetical protein